MWAIRAIVLAYFLGVAAGIWLFWFMYSKEIRKVESKRRRFYP